MLVDGYWGCWLLWLFCSVICGYGIYIRIRKCNDLFLKNGGEECGGDRKDVGKCLRIVCDFGKLMLFILLKLLKMCIMG